MDMFEIFVVFSSPEPTVCDPKQDLPGHKDSVVVYFVLAVGKVPAVTFLRSQEAFCLELL